VATDCLAAGFFAMRAWLAGFDQRIDLTPAAFLIASGWPSS